VQALSSHTRSQYTPYGINSLLAMTIFHGRMVQVWKTPHL
jgi:hypothetical protein